MIKYLLTLLLVFNLSAGIYYVRDGAAGSNNGTDWTNAWEDTDDINWGTFTRGDTLYIADGTYLNDDFDQAESGTTVNYIFKATASEHGTGTGWSSAYGDGEAHFNNNAMSANDALIDFETDYWVFDGKGRTGDTTGYGFRTSTTDVTDITRGVRFTSSASNITIRYVNFSGAGEDVDLNNDVVYCNTASSNITLQYLWIHDISRNLMTVAGGNNWLLEYSFLCRNHNVTDIHQQMVQGGPTATNDFIIRYNKFMNGNGTGYLVPLGGTSHRRWYVYGNVFFITDSARYNCPSGLFGDTSTTEADSMYFYNNVVVDIDGPTSYDAGIAFNWSSANEIIVYNNIWIGSTLGGGWNNVTARDYNAADEDLGETHDQEITSSIFTDYANYDYTLSTGTDAGIDLGSPYNTDMLGNTRGDDGTWDRGAYEYVGTADIANEIIPGGSGYILGGSSGKIY